MPNYVVCKLDQYGHMVAPAISVETDTSSAQNKCDSEADSWITANPGNSPVKRAVADGVFVDVTEQETRPSKKNAQLGSDWDVTCTEVYPKVKFEWAQTSQ